MAIKPVNTDLDFLGSGRIRNLLDGTSPQDAATVAQLNSAVEGLAWKDSVRVATQGNLSLASPGATIDGITMVTNDRVLVRANTLPPENGIYIWNGAAVPMTRAPDASTSNELEQAVVTVEEGTSAGASFRQTTVNFVLDTGNVVWSTFGTSAAAANETTAGIAEIATQAEVNTGTDDTRIVTPLKLANWSGRIKKFSQLVGDGSATSIAVTHNLNSRSVHVQVYQASGTFDVVDCEVELTSVNQATLKFNTAPAIDAYEVTVIG
jgi:hypothetical protein